MKKVENCLDIINNLATSLNGVANFNFISYQSYELLQDRINIKDELGIVIDKALKIRSNYNLPFWDSFNVSLFNTRLSNFDFLEEIKFHNRIDKILAVKNKSVANFLVKQAQNDDYITFCSKVSLTDGTISHIPLLDFHIPINDENENICVGVLRSLKLKGVLLNSGKSYHFYGNNLLTEKELIDLLATALLFAPIIDRAWIAHQLIERKCSLRISKKYSRLPFKITDI